jgi:hypothetical protein
MPNANSPKRPKRGDLLIVKYLLPLVITSLGLMVTCIALFGPNLIYIVGIGAGLLALCILAVTIYFRHELERDSEDPERDDSSSGEGFKSYSDARRVRTIESTPRRGRLFRPGMLLGLLALLVPFVAAVPVILKIGLPRPPVGKVAYVATRGPSKADPAIIVDRDGTLRSDPTMRTPTGKDTTVGVIPYGSSVRVFELSPDGEWYRVSVQHYARPKPNPEAPDVGWMHTTVLVFPTD